MQTVFGVCAVCLLTCFFQRSFLCCEWVTLSTTIVSHSGDVSTNFSCNLGNTQKTFYEKKCRKLQRKTVWDPIGIMQHCYHKLRLLAVFHYTITTEASHSQKHLHSNVTNGIKWFNLCRTLNWSVAKQLIVRVYLHQALLSDCCSKWFPEGHSETFRKSALITKNNSETENWLPIKGLLPGPIHVFSLIMRKSKHGEIAWGNMHVLSCTKLSLGEYVMNWRPVHGFFPCPTDPWDTIRY